MHIPFSLISENLLYCIDILAHIPNGACSVFFISSVSVKEVLKFASPLIVNFNVKKYYIAVKKVLGELSSIHKEIHKNPRIYCKGECINIYSYILEMHSDYLEISKKLIKGISQVGDHINVVVIVGNLLLFSPLHSIIYLKTYI